LPLLLTMRCTTMEEPETSASGTSVVLLPFVGPSFVTALLATSVPPEVSGFGAELARHAVALRYDYLGLTVLAGVLACGPVSLATVAGEKSCLSRLTTYYSRLTGGEATFVSRAAPRPVTMRHDTIARSRASGMVHAFVASRRTPKRNGPDAASR
jgi:hypothetical protein